MQRRRIQLPIQSMMIAVALVALNLGAAIAVSKTHPREPFVATRDSAHFQGPHFRDFFLDALTCRLDEHQPPGAVFQEVDRVVQDPLPETLPQIWSPVIASASVTLLVLGLAMSSRSPLRGSAKSRVAEAPAEGPCGWWQVTGWLTIAIALIGLNFAAAVHRPPWDPSSAELALDYLKSWRASGVFLIKADGRFEYLGRHNDLIFTRSRDAVPPEPDYFSFSAACRSELDVIKVTTIVDKDDGSVLAYGGQLGEVTSNPIVLRHPLRSSLEMWWALIASTSITVLVAVVLWRRAWRNRANGSDDQMSRNSTRWTSARPLLEWAVVGTALVALNMAGAIATWSAQLRVSVSRVKLVERRFWVPSLRDEETWDIRFGFGSLATGEELIRVMSLPRRPTLLQIGAPIIASASITLLVFLVLLGRPASRRRRDAPQDSGGLEAQRSPLRLVRWATIAAALISLNVAGAVYGPFPEPGEEQPCPAVFMDPAMVPDEQGGLLFRDRANRVVKRSANGGGERPATAADYPLPLHGYDGYTHRGGARVKDTVEYRSDGSVVAYEGNPGLMERLASRPRVIRPPTRSFLAVWWPVIGSLSISLVVIGISWCQAQWQFHDPGLESVSQQGGDWPNPNPMPQPGPGGSNPPAARQRLRHMGEHCNGLPKRLQPASYGLVRPTGRP